MNAKKEVNLKLSICKKNDYSDIYVNEFLAAKHYFKNLTTFKRKQYEKKEIDLIINAKNSADISKLINKYKGNKHYRSNPIDVKTWSNYLTSCFPIETSIPYEPTNHSNPFLDGAITIHEIRRVLSKIKAGKAPGSDLISNAFY